MIVAVLFTVALIITYCGLFFYPDTVDGSSVTATAPAEDEFGWTTFGALERKQVSHSVDTAAGEVTTAYILRTSPSVSYTHLTLPTIYSV